MIIGIYTNTERDYSLTVTKNLYSSLTKSGTDVFVYGDAAKLLGTEDGFLKKEKPQVLVSLGGDGTILGIAPFCAEFDIPVLGLNLGNIGFLSGFEANEADKLVKMLLSSKYITESRTMLEIKAGGFTSFALNEAVIKRYDLSGAVSLEAYVNGEFIDRYCADGFIVATPTGSTAYSLSAGGPIITPDAGVLSLTPISPHTLHSRPIVISDSGKVSVIPKELCSVVADGKTAGSVKAGETVNITLSDKKVRFIKAKNASFFERLLSKLNKWGVT